MEPRDVFEVLPFKASGLRGGWSQQATLGNIWTSYPVLSAGINIDAVWLNQGSERSEKCLPA